jgi:hypothetical protein
MVSSIKTLHADGGFSRYYHGLGPALFQGPIGECSSVPFYQSGQLTKGDLPSSLRRHSRQRWNSRSPRI